MQGPCCSSLPYCSQATNKHPKKLLTDHQSSNIVMFRKAITALAAISALLRVGVAAAPVPQDVWTDVITHSYYGVGGVPLRSEETLIWSNVVVSGSTIPTRIVSNTYWPTASV